MVDLNRYMGVWNEIARYPNSFQKGCVSEAGQPTRCRMTVRSLSLMSAMSAHLGKVRSAKCKAWVVDKETNSKLKVSFFWFFAGDYWIIDIADDYSYVVVGHPKRKYLWILSRNKIMEDSTYEVILKRLVEIHHYDTSKLIKTVQQ